MEVCIVGGSFSGVGAAKICLDHGFTPFILDKHPDFGGSWRSYPSHPGVWSSLIANTCKYTSAFSDLLWPPEDPDYPPAASFLNYLLSYINKHSLDRFFHGNSEVVLIDRAGDDYLVRWKSGDEIFEKTFYGVIVAVGFFNTPSINLENPQSFKGTLMHSAYYREPSIFAGKNVVVVGSSFSGSDIAVDAVSTAKSVKIVYKEDNIFFSRYINQLPNEFTLYAMDKKQKPPLIPTLQSSAFGANMLLNTLCNQCARLPGWEFDRSQLGQRFPYMTLYPESFVTFVQEGKIQRVKGEAKGCYEQGLEFADGTRLEADVVVMATGYGNDCPFLSEEISRILQYEPSSRVLSRIMYRSLIHPDLPKFGFTSSVRLTMPGRTELLSKVVVKYIEGSLNVSREEMEQGLRDEEGIRKLGGKGLVMAYDLVSSLDEFLRVSETVLDKEFIEGELGFGKGPVLPCFFNTSTEEQKEMCRVAVAEVKSKFPWVNFSN